jgi:hypothetical protein
MIKIPEILVNFWTILLDHSFEISRHSFAFAIVVAIVVAIAIAIAIIRFATGFSTSAATYFTQHCHKTQQH